MADCDDIVDFEVIETQKENIQSIPGGRSAKQLSQLLSPVPSTGTKLDDQVTLSQSQELKQTIRQEFEKELENVDDADDPLEIYDRYIKWSMSAYPSAQATSESGLLPLVERATKSFLSSSMYKNDPRYLKIWLLYIRLFSDSPRETYAFLAKHSIGESLALFYEEYAAWLEAQGRWAQAEEVFANGVDNEARPKERLLRKYAEFQQRRETKAANDGPTSPALPRMRPALAKKSDPFVAGEEDPQAADRAASQVKAARSTKPGKSKLAVFADGEGSPEASGSGASCSGPGWESIGSIADRKKENSHEAKPWAGEKLDGGKKLAGPKMMVFKDTSLGNLSNENMSLQNAKPGLERITIDAKGRKQYVFADLESVYPNGAGGEKEEFCFEELRARRRGLLHKDWGIKTASSSKRSQKSADANATCQLDLPKPEPKQQEIAPLIDFSDENNENNENKTPGDIPTTVPLKLDSPVRVSKKSKKEDKANRTRKIKIEQVEIKGETQTVQLNLDSPSGPTKVRRKRPEATMTICTKEAMNEVYDIFNQTLSAAGAITTEQEQEDTDNFTGDYTSASESTGTGHLSVGASEYGDDTMADFTTSSRVDTDAESVTGQMTVDSEFSEYSVASTSAIVEVDEDDEDLSVVEVPSHGLVSEQSTSQAQEQYPEEEMETPTSPTGGNATDYFDNGGQGDVMVPMPYRTGKAAGRLPFMTPIVEKTESSLGAITAGGEKTFASMKTPSRQNHIGTMPEIEDDETGPLSSPFQESFENKENDNGKIPQPALTRLVGRTKQPLEESKSHAVATLKETERDAMKKGPIILDAQCNPIDTNIRNTVISQLRPSLNTYTGFFDSRGSSAGQGPEIRKYTKTSAKRETTSSPPTLDFNGCKRTYTIRRELGRGAFAPVYLADSELREEEDHHDFGVQRQEQEVIKMEDPPTSWEFYIIRQAKRRLGVARPSESIVEVHEMHLFDDECYLIEEYRNQGTLLDAINISRAESNGGAMDEQLAMFFTVELFRTVEALHSKGIIHGDIKPDNMLIRLDNSSSIDTAWSPQYSGNGNGGWSDKGLLLIDFGRGIDMRVFKPDVQFIADWKTSEADCAEMREMRPWTFQVDYHGLAGVIHSLLFGKYMETVAERGASLGAGATKTYRIREGLKRYWQTELWAESFDVLLNPLMHLEGEEGRKLPMVNSLRGPREKMETYLESNSEKGVGLKGLLRRLESGLREKRK
ncbi:hypothetical protein BT63DRAFT_429406 [Microthyrium microscopicum]|uniref:Uncharacterized protein n=1 Tax=Microthyrium microscopicum TaxID=703497 RepID=A0A6A6TX61_9PEZI|nr:hypothetical protein BT63DRAFT_429406 [Microthyrium microscopicum]